MYSICTGGWAPRSTSDSLSTVQCQCTVHVLRGLQDLHQTVLVLYSVECTVYELRGIQGLHQIVLVLYSVKCTVHVLRGQFYTVYSTRTEGAQITLVLYNVQYMYWGARVYIR